MFLSGEKVEEESCRQGQGEGATEIDRVAQYTLHAGACQLKAQLLRVASRVPPLALRLREGAHYFQAGAYLLCGGW